MAQARPGPVRASDAGGAAPPRGGGEQAAALGISFNASGATEPGESLAAQGRHAIPGRCAGGPGRSCTSPPTGGRCRAASRRSRRRATRTTRWAMPPSRPCARSGTVRAYQDFRAALQSDCAAQVVRELRPALEPLASCPARRGRSTARPSPSSSPASTRRRRSARAWRPCSRTASAR